MWGCQSHAAISAYSHVLKFWQELMFLCSIKSALFVLELSNLKQMKEEGGVS